MHLSRLRLALPCGDQILQWGPHNVVHEQVVEVSTHNETLLLVRWGDISFPITSSVCQEGVGGWWGLVGAGGGYSAIVGKTLSTVGTPTDSLQSRGCWEPQRATMEREPGERHQHPQPNPPALYICAGPVSKARPPFFSLKSPPPPHHAPPLFFSFTVILQQEKGRAFVVAHSVTQTQDLRLSLGFSQSSLCSCRLEERGGNSYFST